MVIVQMKDGPRAGPEKPKGRPSLRTQKKRQISGRGVPWKAYINSKKTLAEGRRIPKDKAVDNPTHQEIRDVLVAAGLKCGVENKIYSREKSKELLYRGRIRVQIKNDSGVQIQNDFPTRESVMLFLGAMIPKLKSRSSKHSGGSDTGPSTNASGSKKKGKGRR